MWGPPGVARPAPKHRAAASSKHRAAASSKHRAAASSKRQRRSRPQWLRRASFTRTGAAAWPPYAPPRTPPPVQLEAIVYQVENGKGAMPAWDGRLSE
jgi:hypothetical protein